MKRLITIALCTFLSQMCTAQVMMLFSQDSLTGITSPLDVDSLFYWFAADVGVTDSLGGAIANNEGVGQWNDLSGNGYHVTQSTDTQRPVYKATGGPGGYPAIQFDGSNDFLASASHWWGSDDLTVFVVMKFWNATRNSLESILSRIYDLSNRQWDWFGEGVSAKSYASSFYAYNNGSGANNVLYATAANWKHTNYKVHAIVHNGATSTSMYTDGSPISLAQTVAGTGDGTIYDYSNILVVGSRNPGASFLQGSISEIIVYSRALSAAERAAIENYLNKKYDLY